MAVRSSRGQLMTYNMVLKFTILVCSLCVVDGALDKAEGEACEKNGERGICIGLKNCSSAIDEIRNKQRPQLCSFKDIEPIVCCENNSTSAGITTITSASSAGSCKPIQPTFTAPKTGQKAWDKCIEYQERYVFPCMKSILQEGDVRVDRCQHKAEALIVGGTAADSYDLSHMVQLGTLEGNDDGNVTWIEECDGALINERFVLTSAHCVGLRQCTVSHVLVRLNIGCRVKQAIKHPDYKAVSRQNDIALLELEIPIVLDSLIVPACLPVGEVGIEKPLLAGFGIVYRSDPLVLQKNRVLKVPASVCTADLPPRLMKRGLDERIQGCYQDRTNSTCQGSSGVLQIENQRIRCMYTVVGLASFVGGYGCAGSGAGVYTIVAAHLSWIEGIVWPDM